MKYYIVPFYFQIKCVIDSLVENLNLLHLWQHQPREVFDTLISVKRQEIFGVSSTPYFFCFSIEERLYHFLKVSRLDIFVKSKNQCFTTQPRRNKMREYLKTNQSNALKAMLHNFAFSITQR